MPGIPDVKQNSGRHAPYPAIFGQCFFCASEIAVPNRGGRSRIPARIVALVGDVQSGWFQTFLMSNSARFKRSSSPSSVPAHVTSIRRRRPSALPACRSANFFNAWSSWPNPLPLACRHGCRAHESRAERSSVRAVRDKKFCSLVFFPS